MGSSSRTQLMDALGGWKDSSKHHWHLTDAVSEWVLRRCRGVPSVVDAGSFKLVIDLCDGTVARVYQRAGLTPADDPADPNHITSAEELLPIERHVPGDGIHVDVMQRVERANRWEAWHLFACLIERGFKLTDAWPENVGVIPGDGRVVYFDGYLKRPDESVPPNRFYVVLDRTRFPVTLVTAVGPVDERVYLRYDDARGVWVRHSKVAALFTHPSRSGPAAVIEHSRWLNCVSEEPELGTRPDWPTKSELVDLELPVGVGVGQTLEM